MDLVLEKRSVFFVIYILPEGDFFIIFIFSQYMVYWINFKNIYILLHHIKKRYIFHTINQSISVIQKNIFLNMLKWFPIHLQQLFMLVVYSWMLLITNQLTKSSKLQINFVLCEGHCIKFYFQTFQMYIIHYIRKFGNQCKIK